MKEKTKTFKQFLAESYNVVYPYSSAQVYIPPTLAHAILEWSDHNVRDEFLYSDFQFPSFGREEDLHITLIYRLHTEDHRPVEKSLLGEKAGEVQLGKMSIFTSNDNFDVLKIDVESNTLHRLRETLTTSLRASDSYPSYVPHVTIAYVKKGLANQFVGDETFCGEKFAVNELVFLSRTGDQKKIKIGAS